MTTSQANTEASKSNKAHNAAASDIPSHLLQDNSSQDVFLICHRDDRVTLVERKHAGHQFFRCLATLKRSKFFQELKQDPSSRRTTTALVRSVCYNGRGRIYVRNVHSNQWREVRDTNEAAELFYQTLVTMYSITPEEEKEPPRQVSLEPTTAAAVVDNRKRSLSSAMEAAEGLLLVHSSSSFPETKVEDRLPPKKRVRFLDDLSQHGLSDESCDERCPRAKQNMRVLFNNSQQHHMLPRYGSPHTGIPVSAIREDDVLCGESGQGVLATSNLGNLRFQALIDANASEFYSGMDKRKMLHMAKLAVNRVHEASPRGRFLVANPHTGLWHEVKVEKAWSKALRSFQTNEQAAKQREAIQLLLENREKRDRARRLNAVKVSNAI